MHRESRDGSGTRDKVEELQNFAAKRGPSLMLRSLGRCGSTEGLVFLPLQTGQDVHDILLAFNP